MPLAWLSDQQGQPDPSCLAWELSKGKPVPFHGNGPASALQDPSPRRGDKQQSQFWGRTHQGKVKSPASNQPRAEEFPRQRPALNPTGSFPPAPALGGNQQGSLGRLGIPPWHSSSSVWAPQLPRELQEPAFRPQTTELSAQPRAEDAPEMPGRCHPRLGMVTSWSWKPYPRGSCKPLLMLLGTSRGRQGHQQAELVSLCSRTLPGAPLVTQGEQEATKQPCVPRRHQPWREGLPSFLGLHFKLMFCSSPHFSCCLLWLEIFNSRLCMLIPACHTLPAPVPLARRSQGTNPLFPGEYSLVEAHLYLSGVVSARL